MSESVFLMGNTTGFTGTGYAGNASFVFDRRISLSHATSARLIRNSYSAAALFMSGY